MHQRVQSENSIDLERLKNLTLFQRIRYCQIRMKTSKNAFFEKVMYGIFINGLFSR